MKKNEEFVLSIFRNDAQLQCLAKEDARIRRTKMLLMQALIKLMEKEDFDKIGVSEICEKAQVHRATFYKHYRDKFCLLEQTLETLKRYIFFEAKENFPEKEASHFLAIASSAFDFIEEHRTTIKNVMNHNRASMLMDMIFYTTEQEFKRCASDDEHQIKVHGAPMPVAMSFFTGGFSALMLWWLKHDDICTKTELLKYLAGFLPKNTTVDF